MTASVSVALATGEDDCLRLRTAPPVEALMQALQPFEGAIDELLACLPPDLA
jgi:hypothetical protein